MRYSLSLLLIACIDTGKETGSEDTGIITHHGVCHHYGEVDNVGTTVLNCIEASGSQWNALTFKQACENDWDAFGTHMASEQYCPRGWTAYCEFASGDTMIGATWEGTGYAGRVFYYDGSRWSDPASHCNGNFVEAAK
jgi:hypothetical protein